MLTTTTQAALDGGETVKRLLLFTRAAPEQDTQSVDLAKVVRDAAQLTAPRWRDAAQAEGRPISLHIEAEGHPTIQGSPAQLRELMTNLIFNAVDALPTGGTIRLRVLAELGQGIIEVADSGVGMSAEVQAARIRAVLHDQRRARHRPGSGDGVRDRRAARRAHRRALGTGRRDDLPHCVPSGRRRIAGFERLSRCQQTRPQLEPLRPLRVLVVDDEPMMTKAVARMLKPSGHSVTVAGIRGRGTRKVGRADI